ncbi:hypothetical protein ACM39_13830 [Chryseobacterium sp. FH2]|uniref:RHS repeat-associated core domain-containing protein n=1 Tax=Chryseobacterium sp. FH2 TaxID=1674291 RepID=UPI00065ACB9C|nr:hypothetical protein ACM39_13830 [Chryseobacterium sp. FH2]
MFPLAPARFYRVGDNNKFHILVTYNYKYNGKELQETGMYDYGARFYMPDIGRWGDDRPVGGKILSNVSLSYVRK